MEITLDILSKLAVGFGTTLLLFALTLIFSMPLGLCFSLLSKSRIKAVRFIMKVIIWIIRGTPLMLQVLFVSFIPFYVFGIGNKTLASIFGIKIVSLNFVFVSIAFVLNYSCYFAEIFRGAISSVPKGQYEAGQVLGMTKKQVFRKIILLQVVKKAIAPVSNEVITLVKDTALAQILGVVDLLSAASNAVNTYVILTPFVYAIVFYLTFNGLLTLLFGYFEKRLSFYKE